MSRKRSSRAVEVKDVSSHAVLIALLDELCVQLGFCLAPDDRAELAANPPAGVDAFTDEVIRAEGMDPVLMDSSLRRRMRAVVEERASRIL